MSEPAKVYLTRAGKRGEDEEYSLEHGSAVIGFQEVPSLEGAKDYDAVLKIVRENLPTKKPRAIGNIAGQLWAFAVAIDKDDIVVLPRKLTSQVAIGRVKGPYPPPHSAHFVSPEKRYFGRRARLKCFGSPFDAARRIATWRVFTCFHSSSSTIRSSGTRDASSARPSLATGSCPREASRLAQRNFDFLCSPSSVGQGLGDVLGLKVRVLAENLVSRASGGDEPDDRSDGDPHAADARLSAHYGGVTSDARQLWHVASDSLDNSPIVDELAHAANRDRQAPQLQGERPAGARAQSTSVRTSDFSPFPFNRHEPGRQGGL